MMKTKNVVATLLASSAALFSVGASADTGYVSLGLGQSHLNADCSGIPSCKTNDTAVKVTGGYNLGSGFSAELGYMDFGKFSANDGAGTSVDVKPSAWTLGAAYTMPFTPQWSGSVRLGAARVHTDVSAAVTGVGSGSASETKTKPYYGLGVDYAVAQNVKVGFGADFTQAEFQGAKNNVRALTLGLTYGF